MDERVSYWLIPAPPEKAHFLEIILGLAKRFDAPVFEPHLTIYSTPLAASEDPKAVLKKATRKIRPLMLQTMGVAHSTRFTKTLFVEFAPDDALTTLSEELRRRSAERADYVLNPHLSLIYAPLTAAITDKLARDVSIPMLVRFNAVKAIISRGAITSREDVETWRVVAEGKLLEPKI
jgi:hypothetical protein